MRHVATFISSCWTIRRFNPLRFGVRSHITPLPSGFRLSFLHNPPVLTMAAAQKEPSPLVIVKSEIELTEIETKIFDHLLATLRHFHLQTELRVAGGWVRDKLLGKDCFDIDIAIDNMLGSEFVDKVVKYLSSTGEVVQGVGVIPRNPDQSKHLETARMRLYDLWIDFVNLRCENYSENSRIPTMEFGTAKEDAYRRDLTINSLFYNINTGTVEDFTARGIKDLKSGKIVTPLPPKTTFLDDPLRVLRAIRFGARFGFDLDDELKEAAACEEVRNALSAKISRERIGTEIDLMISGNQPVLAMRHIVDLSLFSVVFAFPHELDLPSHQNYERSSLAYMGAAWDFLNLFGPFSFSADEKRIVLYAAMFLPFKSITYTDTKGKKQPILNFILKESLKRKSSDPEIVIKIHSCVQTFLNLIPWLARLKNPESPNISDECDFLDVPPATKLRVVTGFLVREIKEFWRIGLLVSLLLHIEEEKSVQKLRLVYMLVEQTIKTLELDNVWQIKPLVNGKVLMQVLQLKCGGPLISEWQKKILAWQLAHPHGTVSECIQWINENHHKRSRLE